MAGFNSSKVRVKAPNPKRSETKGAALRPQRSLDNTFLTRPFAHRRADERDKTWQQHDIQKADVAFLRVCTPADEPRI